MVHNLAEYYVKEIAPVLAFIFQQSYDTSQVPSDWQLANVTAVFKKGDKTNPANYRPVLVPKCLTQVPKCPGAKVSSIRLSHIKPP
jgi:hypothetical protein